MTTHPRYGSLIIPAAKNNFGALLSAALLHFSNLFPKRIGSFCPRRKLFWGIGII